MEDGESDRAFSMFGTEIQLPTADSFSLLQMWAMLSQLRLDPTNPEPRSEREANVC